MEVPYIMNTDNPNPWAAPTPTPVVTPPSKPKMSRKKKVLIGVGATVVVLGGIAAVSDPKKEEDTTAPAKTTTVAVTADNETTTPTEPETTKAAPTTTVPKPTTTPATTTPPTAPPSTESRATLSLRVTAADPAKFAKIIGEMFTETLYFDRMDLFTADEAQRLVTVQATSGYSTDEFVIDNAQDAVYALALAMWDPEQNVFDETVALHYLQDGHEWLISGEQLVAIAQSTLPVASIVS